MNEDLQKRLSALEGLISTQRDCIPPLNDPAHDYMHGMLNGMICSYSVFTDDSPVYYTRQRKHVKNNIRHKGRR